MMCFFTILLGLGSWISWKFQKGTLFCKLQWIFFFWNSMYSFPYLETSNPCASTIIDISMVSMRQSRCLCGLPRGQIRYRRDWACATRVPRPARWSAWSRGRGRPRPRTRWPRTGRSPRRWPPGPGIGGRSDECPDKRNFGSIEGCRCSPGFSSAVWKALWF